MVKSNMLCLVEELKLPKNNEESQNGISLSRNHNTSSRRSFRKVFSRGFSFRKRSPLCSLTTSSPIDKDSPSPVHSLVSNGNDERNQEISLRQHAAAAAAANELLSNTPGSSKARQKKFHRHFREVPQEERVINYFSCALIGDILMHGNLYITKNYFAFYSNMFGNVHKILIPTGTILQINKEKTVLSKPNAVAVITVKENHLFGLFLSRDTTYKLMIQVWNAAMNPLPNQLLSIYKDNSQSSSSHYQQSGCEDDSSLSGSEIISGSPDLLSTSYSNTYKNLTDNAEDAISHHDNDTDNFELGLKRDNYSQTIEPKWCLFTYSASKVEFLLSISTILLAILFLSAAILLYRINSLQQIYSQNNVSSIRSANEIQEFLCTNLHYIIKVRKALEALSQIMGQEPDIFQENFEAEALPEYNYHA